jgi:hypothetical protein
MPRTEANQEPKPRSPNEIRVARTQAANVERSESIGIRAHLVMSTADRVKTRTRFLAPLGALVMLTACQKESAREEAPPVARPRSSVEAPAPAPTASQPSDPAAAARAGMLESDAGVGEWVESTAYKFKVSNIQRCADPQASPGSSEPQMLRVGVTVHVLSKYDELFVAPRDVKIEKGGEIMQSVVNPKPIAGCSPLLEPKTLRHDQVASGIAVFELPDDSYLRAGLVTFQPTRWGGAPRVEVKLGDATLKRLKFDAPR